MDDAEYEASIVEGIAEQGWYCTCVGGEGEQPGFAYSIGFADRFKAPEFIVFGLDFKLMHNMLWRVFDRLEEGAQVRDGESWPGLIDKFDCIVRAVHPSNIVRDYFNSAMWYHWEFGSDEPLTAAQIVWPGAVDGYFPWEEKCDQIVRDYQPPLYLPNPQLH